MRRMRTGRDAAPAGSASSAKPPGASGVTARPTTWVRPATGWWERMNAGRKILQNQWLSVKGAPVRFQKAVPGSKEIAAVKRR